MKEFVGKLVIAWTVVLIVLSWLCAYYIGYNQAVWKAEPFVEGGKQYIVFDNQVHDYGEVKEVQ